MEIVREKGIDEVLEFWDILKFVIDKVEPNKNYRDDVFLQAVRVMKWYGFVSKSDDRKCGRGNNPS